MPHLRPRSDLALARASHMPAEDVICQKFHCIGVFGDPWFRGWDERRFLDFHSFTEFLNMFDSLSCCVAIPVG
jgi:hypothetical protein